MIEMLKAMMEGRLLCECGHHPHDGRCWYTLKIEAGKPTLCSCREFKLKL